MTKKRKISKHKRRISGTFINKMLIIILLILPLIYFSPLLSGKKMMYGSDWLLEGYSHRNWMAESIKLYGEGPLWNPNLFAGLPAGNPYTLLTILYLILPVHLAWTYIFVLAAFLAGLGIYLYLKELKLPLYISFLSGIAYMGCGSLLSMTWPGHDGKIMAAALFPFVLLFLHKALKKQKVIYFLFAGGIGGICAVHAHFQLTYYAGVVCAFYLLLHLIWQRKQNKFRGNLKLIIYSIFGLVLAGGIAMIKFLPIFGGFGWGSRGGIERGYEFATSWSLPTMELVDLLTPHFSGILNNYWGKNYFKLDTHYLGILPLLLAFVGVIFKIKERYVKFFLGLAIVATIFSLGRYTPFYKIPYYLLPQVSRFRAPSMAFYLVAFSFAILAAFGLQALVENLKSLRKLTLSLSIIFGCVLLFVLVCIGAKNSVLATLRSHLEPIITTNYGLQLAQQKINNLYQNYPHFLKGLGKSLLLIGINSVLIILVAVKKLKLETLALLALTAILIFDQWSIDKKFLKVEPHPDRLYAPDVVVDFLRKTDEDLYRVFPLIYEHSKDGYLMHHGIQSVGGYVANPFHRYQELIGAGKSVMFTPPNLVKYRNLLDILNVKYVISVWIPDDLSQYDEKTQEMIQNFKLNFIKQWGISWEGAHEELRLVFRSERGYAVYKNETALPRIWLVPNYEILDKDKVLERMKEAEFDPRTKVILEEDPGVPSRDTVLDIGDIEITSYQPNKIVCEATLKSPGFLLLSENWHPDWQAYVDGKVSKMFIADYTLRAVWLGEGHHEVTFICDSKYFRLGAWTSFPSFLFVVGIAIYWGISLRKQKNRKQSKNFRQK